MEIKLLKDWSISYDNSNGGKTDFNFKAGDILQGEPCFDGDWTTPYGFIPNEGAIEVKEEKN